MELVDGRDDGMFWGEECLRLRRSFLSFPPGKPGGAERECVLEVEGEWLRVRVWVLVESMGFG